MRKIFNLLALLALTLPTVTAHAARLGAPFIPEEDARFDNIEGNSTVNSQNGLHQKQVAVATYDFDVNAGASATIALGATLPAGAVINRSYLYFEKRIVGSANLAFQCGTANNILSSAALSTYHVGDMLEGVSTGASTLFQKISEPCNISAVIGTGSLTAGKVSAFVEYFVHP